MNYKSNKHLYIQVILSIFPSFKKTTHQETFSATRNLIDKLGGYQWDYHDMKTAIINADPDTYPAGSATLLRRIFFFV